MCIRDSATPQRLADPDCFRCGDDGFYRSIVNCGIYDGDETSSYGCCNSHECSQCDGTGSYEKECGNCGGLDGIASKYHVDATRFVCLSKERTLTLLCCLSGGVSEPLSNVQLDRTRGEKKGVKGYVQSQMLTLNVERTRVLSRRPSFVPARLLGDAPVVSCLLYTSPSPRDS